MNKRIREILQDLFITSSLVVCEDFKEATSLLWDDTEERTTFWARSRDGLLQVYTIGSYGTN